MMSFKKRYDLCAAAVSEDTVDGEWNGPVYTCDFLWKPFSQKVKQQQNKVYFFDAGCKFYLEKSFLRSPVKSFHLRPNESKISLTFSTGYYSATKLFD